MYTGDIMEVMDFINLAIGVINRALNNGDKIANFTIEDEETSVIFGMKTLNDIEHLFSVKKVNENTLRDIYLSLVDWYKDNIGIGATMEYKNKNIQWNIAPVIGDKVLIEFISAQRIDQEWFKEELFNSAIEKKGSK